MFHVEHLLICTPGKALLAGVSTWNIYELCKPRRKSAPSHSIPIKYDSKVHALESGIAIGEIRNYSAIKLSGFS